MYTFPVDSLVTESDVEQKVIYPVLKDILKFHDAEIKTKQYLPTYDIGKRASKKSGYYPDYMIIVDGLPCIVIEAKSPNEDVEEGYREACMYASEINSNYESEINPCKHVVSTDGLTLTYGIWDDKSTKHTVTIGDFSAITIDSSKFTTEFSRESISREAKEIRNRLLPTKWYKPLRFIGGESRQRATIPMNSFAADLSPLLRRYFDPDETRFSEEVLTKGYCSSEEITGYNSTLESLLKESILKKEELTELRTSKNSAKVFDDALNRKIKEKSSIPDPLIVILGGVGSGKSMFIERYVKRLVSDDVKKSTLWIKIDFNKASVDTVDKDLDNWIREQFISTYKNALCDDGLFSYELLVKIFAPDINELKKGRFKKVFEQNRPLYDEKEAEFLDHWSADNTRLTKNIIRYHAGDMQTCVVAIFDNVDRKDKDQQLKIFQAVQSFREENKCFGILSLRDETYDAYKNEPPLDAFSSAFAFRIITPRFIDVVKRRLELMLEYLSSEVSDHLTYTLPSGATVRYPGSNLGKYIFSIYVSIFNPTRMTSVILQAVSGGNIRLALEMFTEILLSGHVKENIIFSLTRGTGGNFPEYLLIKILMRRNNQFYHGDSGYIKNILSVPETSNTANNFLVVELLSYLSNRRKEIGSLKIEGYILVSDIINHLTAFSYSVEDVNWALERTLVSGLIQADHQRKYGINNDVYVKITASGYYHLKQLSQRDEYLRNISYDTFINNHEIAKAIGAREDDSYKNQIEILNYLHQYLESEFAAISNFCPTFATNQTYSYSIIECLDSELKRKSQT